jgi:hypothetical protein
MNGKTRARAAASRRADSASNSTSELIPNEIAKIVSENRRPTGR